MIGQRWHLRRELLDVRWIDDRAWRSRPRRWDSPGPPRSERTTLCERNCAHGWTKAVDPRGRWAFLGDELVDLDTPSAPRFSIPAGEAWASPKGERLITNLSGP